MTSAVRMVGFAEAIATLGKVADPNARHNQEAAQRILSRAQAAVREGAPGIMAPTVTVAADRAPGTGRLVVVSISHPAAPAFEYGRTKFYTTRSPGKPAGIGNNRGHSRRTKGSFMRGGVVVKRPGMKARPFAHRSLERVAGELQQMLAAGLSVGWHATFGGH